MTASSRLLARNTGFNLLGYGLPVAVAVVAIPFLITGLGTDRFGVLTLAWAAIGYFGLLDLGIGRSLTQALSVAIAHDQEDEVGVLTWTALALMLGLGILGAIGLALATPWVITTALKIPAELHGEGILAFRLLAFSLPAVITTAGLRGVLEAHQHFGAATALRLPFAIFTFLGPLAVLPFSRSLAPVVGSLVAARVLLWAAHLAVVLRRYGALRHGPSFSRAHMAPLLRTGGWMTVSNVVSPVMVNIDRFFIAGFIGSAAVAYYVTPFELAAKLLLVPSALMGVLFPAFAASFAKAPGLAARRMDQAIRVMLVAMFPLALGLTALASEGLTVWVGREFAASGAPVLHWLAAGMLINAIGQMPFGMLQATGRSDLTAMLHVVELPLYLALLWVLALRYGITGVAMAWTLRIAIDTALLLVLARRQFHAGQSGTHAARLLLPLLVTLGVIAAIPQLTPRLFSAGLVLAGFALYAWTRILRPEERALLSPSRGVGLPSRPG